VAGAWQAMQFDIFCCIIAFMANLLRGALVSFPKYFITSGSRENPTKHTTPTPMTVEDDIAAAQRLRSGASSSADSDPSKSSTGGGGSSSSNTKDDIAFGSTNMDSELYGRDRGDDYNDEIMSGSDMDDDDNLLGEEIIVIGGGSSSAAAAAAADEGQIGGSHPSTRQRVEAARTGGGEGHSDAHDPFAVAGGEGRMSNATVADRDTEYTARRFNRQFNDVDAEGNELSYREVMERQGVEREVEGLKEKVRELEGKGKTTTVDNYNNNNSSSNSNSNSKAEEGGKKKKSRWDTKEEDKDEDKEEDKEKEGKKKKRRRWDETPIGE